jgi:hypothetical protein
LTVSDDEAFEAEKAALLDAVVGVVRASHAMEQGREAAEETRVAVLSLMQARLPARAQEVEAYLMEQAGPDSARVEAFVHGMVAHMAQMLIDNFTLEELQGFNDFQRTEEFQEMAPEFAKELQRPLRDFQDTLIRDMYAHFR